MYDTYKTETLTHHGKTYRVEWVYDRDAGTPWDHSDGHGVVSDWETRDKRPGELILNQNGRSKRFYDFAASVKKARAEGWNTAPYNWKTKGDDADINASLWGVEDDGYCSDHRSIIQELIGDCEHEETRTTYPVTHCAV